jgi:uncharacterized protein YkwD
MGPMLNRPTSTRRRLPQLAAAALAVAALGAGAPAAYAAPSYCGADEAAPDTHSNAAWERETLSRLNTIRHDRGLPALRPNARLRTAAMAHAHDMLRRHYFAHFGPGGESWSGEIRRTGYLARHGAWTIGQNIAWGRYQCRKPSAIVYAWMQSPPHRQVILTRRFRDIGIAVADGAPTPVQGPASTYVADFGVRR